jgi:hypothetical protein
LSETDFEMEKWTAEQQLREREIALKEREQKFAHENNIEREKWTFARNLQEIELSIKEEDLRLRKEELERSRWRSPLVVAILAAAVAALGNAAVALVNGLQGQTLEDTRAESARILEMVKTGSADKAAENLRFLADAGLVTNTARLAAIRHFLETRSPGQGPFLPSSAVASLTSLAPANLLPSNDPLRRAAGTVGQLTGKNGTSCTAFLVARDLVITPGFCVDNMQAKSSGDISFIPPGENRTAGGKPISVVWPPRETISFSSDPGVTNSTEAEFINNVVLLGLDAPAASDWLTLNETAPQIGTPLSILLFLSGHEEFVSREPNCRVSSTQDNRFSYSCTTGVGSAGAPVFTADGTRVVGIHLGGRMDEAVGFAVRADRILEKSKILRGYSQAKP